MAAPLLFSFRLNFNIIFEQSPAVEHQPQKTGISFAVKGYQAPA
jgi:hypothetical protein